MNLRPLDDRIILRKKEIDYITDSGLFIPDTVDQESMEGTVVAVGPGKFDKNNKRIPPVVKVGDKVIFGEWAAKDIDIFDETLLVMREGDIIGILTEK